MTARIKPYHTTQTYWKSILSNLNMIPMNQRNYDWDNEPQIIKFLNDLFDIFENTNFYEKMGSIIYYTGNNDGKEVWDGQQRLITIILISISTHNHLALSLFMGLKPWIGFPFKCEFQSKGIGCSCANFLPLGAKPVNTPRYSVSPENNS